MTRGTRLIGASVVAGLTLAGCGFDDTADADDQRFPANTQVGSAYLHVPDGWDFMPDEMESEVDEMVGFSESLEGGATRYFYVREGFQQAASVEHAVQVFRAAAFGGIDVYDVEEVEMPGADHAVTMDYSYELDTGEVTSRWWMMQSEDHDAVVGVEYGGHDLQLDEIEEFGESIELRPDADSEY